MSEAYDLVNKAWKNTCRVLLGEEVGELKDYREYLLRFIEPVSEGKSALSGKKVILSSASEFPKGVKVLSNDEAAEYGKMLENSPLDINSIKDLDSIVEAMGEKFYYAGDIVLGDSREVEGANRCVNSSFVFESSEIYDSKYMAFCSRLRYGENDFGSSIGGDVKFTIKSLEGYKTMRCFEVIRTNASSDCAYTGSCEGCISCMFSFNLRNKRHCIGNTQLSKEKYGELSRKLLAEIRETLKAKKRVPSIVDIIGA